MRTLVYKYGLLRPTGGADITADAIKLAHRYRNELTAIERGKRAALRSETSTRDGIAALEHAFADAEVEVQRALTAIKSARAEKRSRETSAESKATLAAAKAAKREAERALREARRSESIAAWDGVATGLPDVNAYLVARAAHKASKAGPNSSEKAELREARETAAFAIADSGLRDHPVRRFAALDAIALRAASLRRGARALSGIPHGTYSLVEEASDKSARDLPLYDRKAQPNDPRFLRFDGRGRIGVQTTGDLRASDILAGTDTRVRVERLPDPEHVTGRRKGQRALLHLRVGSDGRAPVWATWPMVMHRPIPDAAVITRVVVSRSIDGPRERWDVCFTVNLPDVSPRVDGAHAVGVDFGWRKIGDEVRVAVWAAEDGTTGELRLPADLLESVRYAESVRSIRDRLFTETVTRLVAWRSENDALLPDWFREATAYAYQWKSPGRLAGLVRRWRENRFDGDSAMFSSLADHVSGSSETGWLHRDRHLWQIESGVRSKALLRRRDIYRVWSAGMAERFGVLVLEKFDLRKVAVAQPIEDETADNSVARSNRFAVAVSELRGALEQAFASRGGRVEVVPAQGTTKTCADCGHVNAFDAATAVHFICTNCGVSHDQDENAGRNILARRERGSDGETPGPARNGENESDFAPVRESRWVKAKRLAAEREERERTARKTLHNAAE